MINYINPNISYIPDSQFLNRTIVIIYDTYFVKRIEIQTSQHATPKG